MKMKLLILMYLSLVVASAQKSLYFRKEQINNLHSQRCEDSCTFTLVESMPENLTYSAADPLFFPTYLAHKRLLQRAKKSVHLSTFYWTLEGNDTSYHDGTSWQGEDIYNHLLTIAKDGKIDLKIAQNVTNKDTEELASAGAQVRTVDFERLMHGGVLHTKMWLVDDTHFYVGSSNFDWRSYTQVKETGVLVENCPCLASDAAKLFEVYWYLGDPHAVIPKPWPESYSTKINATSPVEISYNDTKGLVYLSSSPPPFCPTGRSVDIDAIVQVMRAAEKFIYVSVMDYMPLFIYTNPQSFWPIIDNELRRAAIDKRVKVYFLASHWEHTLKDMYAYLRSLDELHTTSLHKVDLRVKMFTVPADSQQRKIPFARVNHSKFMVTDKHAYIGTSNWTGDYFKYTGGIGFVLLQPGNSSKSNNGTDESLRQQLESLFMRDWNSEYAKPIY